MKLKTFKQRDVRFQKAQEMLVDYINGRAEALGLEMGALKPKSITLKYMTLGDLGEYQVPPFQRWIQAGRLKNIADKMFLYRYDHSKPITVTLPGKFANDGLHRYTVADTMLDPSEKVPVVILEFGSLAEEAAYFKAMQHPDGGAPVATDRIKAAFIAKEPYAICMYKLGLIDGQSEFATKVAFRKNISKSFVDDFLHDQFIKNKSQIPVGAFTRMYHWIGLEYRRTWEKRTELYLNDLVVSMNYADILSRMNHFGRWLFALRTP